MKPGDLVIMDDYMNVDLCLVLDIDSNTNSVKLVNHRTMEVDLWGYDWILKNCEVINETRGSGSIGCSRYIQP